MANNYLSIEFTKKRFGKDLEEVMSFYLTRWSEGNNGFKDTTNTDKDFYEGTDAVVYGVPVDFTANPYKNNTSVFDFSSIISFSGHDVTIKFGVRTGNGFVNFETPTLVIFVEDLSKSMQRDIDEFGEAFFREIDNLLDTGFDLYWSFVDSYAVNMA